MSKPAKATVKLGELEVTLSLQPAGHLIISLPDKWAVISLFPGDGTRCNVTLAPSSFDRQKEDAGS